MDVHTAGRTADLSTADLHRSLEDPALTSMNFLNEIAIRYPDALSFAAGRPYEGFFEPDEVDRYLRRFRDHLAVERGMTPGEVTRILHQYGRTKGIMHDLIARNLAVDEGMAVDPEAVVVTVGCQEAMYLVLRALRADERDVLLTVRPTYVGIEGAARLVDMPLVPVAGGPGGLDLDDLVSQVRRVRAAGLRPRACYVIPDFANPSGLRLDLATRRRLLEVAQREDLLVLEDNPYGLFHGDADRLPTLKRLDTARRVVYLGSFAKTVLPGARVGYLVADQRVVDQTGAETLLADHLSKIKSMVTVNTSPIAQAVVAGKLLEHDCSLARATAGARRVYADNLRRIQDGLARRFPVGSGVTWNAPAGGFFLVVTLPVPADNALLELSAGTYGVLWTPMRHFFTDGGGERQLRLSASTVEPAQVETGLDRLAALLAERIGT